MTWMWRSAVLTGAGLLWLSTLAWGQATDITVDITRTNLIWTWAQGEGGPVEKWLIRCGPTSTVYTILVELAAPSARSIPIRQVTPDVGTWFCAIAATNRYATSPPSLEVTYEAGKAPVAVSAFRIEAQ